MVWITGRISGVIHPVLSEADDLVGTRNGFKTGPFLFSSFQPWVNPEIDVPSLGWLVLAARQRNRHDKNTPYTDSVRRFFIRLECNFVYNGIDRYGTAFRDGDIGAQHNCCAHQEYNDSCSHCRSSLFLTLES